MDTSSSIFNETFFSYTVRRAKRSQGWIILGLVVTLGIIFIILGILIGILFGHFSNIKGDLSKLKDKDDHQMDLEDFKAIKKDLDDTKQKFLQEIKAVNKTLDIIFTPCPAGWTMSGSSCYYVSEDKASWEEARDKCSEMNSILVMIKDKTELDTLSKLYKMKRKYWFGMRRDPDKVENWKWLDGTEVTFTNWDSGEPNFKCKREHCAETMSGPWNYKNMLRSILYQVVTYQEPLLHCAMHITGSTYEM